MLISANPCLSFLRRGLLATVARSEGGEAVDLSKTITLEKIFDPGLLDEGALDLRPALFAFVVERPRHRGAGLPFAQSGKLVAVSRKDLVSGGDDQLHNCWG